MFVGQKIKTQLKDNGITQTFVANKAGIPVQKLNLSLNGNRKLDFDEYELICGVLSVGTDKFLTPRLPGGKQKEGDQMKNIQIFENNEFGSIRTQIINDEPYFCLADVCHALDLEQPSRVKSRLKPVGVTTGMVIDSVGR